MYEVFFFSSRRRHTRCSRDWSSDVCSSDLSVPSVSSSSYRPEKAGQHRDRNRDISGGNQDGHNLGQPLNPWRVNRMAEPERLKHAPQPVIEVVAQHDHGDDVEHRRRPELKSRHYVVVHVVNIEGTAWMDRAKREIQQMV